MMLVKKRCKQRRPKTIHHIDQMFLKMKKEILRQETNHLLTQQNNKMPTGQTQEQTKHYKKKKKKNVIQHSPRISD